MAKHVEIASLLFETQGGRGDKDTRHNVICELRKKMKELSGTGLNLLVTSEGVEALGLRMEEAESPDKPGPFLKLYMEFARKEKCHVAGSLKLLEGGRVYNSVVFIDGKGGYLGAYSKTFLTIGELEQGLTPGDGAKTFDTKIGRLGGAICFDLNFRELRDEYAGLHPDIIVFSSMYHGGLVQKTWAYECRSFFVSALPFHGGGILDPFGRELALTDCYTSVARARVNLDRVVAHLDYNRDKFPKIKRKYGDDVTIDIPANVGSALIYSESMRRTAADIADEFRLELLDDYFDRARKANSGKRNVTCNCGSQSCR